MPPQLQDIRDLTSATGYLKAQWKRYTSPTSILPQAWALFLALEVFILLVLAINYRYAVPDISIEELIEDSIGPWDYATYIDPTKMALLLETRPQAMLAPLILQFVSVVPPEWKFRFMGSDGSVAYLRSLPSMKRLIDAGKLETTYLPSNVTTNSQETLSAFFTDHWTYDVLLQPAEHVLVFQTDSILCANSARNINEFTKYVWVGAPWGFSEWGGNGGLSLRSVKMLRELLKNETRPAGIPKMEDAWLHDLMIDRRVADMCPRNISRDFSSEMLYTYHPMGYHTGGNGAVMAASVWGRLDLRVELYDWCPEVKMIVDMDATEFVPGNCSETW